MLLKLFTHLIQNFHFIFFKIISGLFSDKPGHFVSPFLIVFFGFSFSKNPFWMGREYFTFDKGVFWLVNQPGTSIIAENLRENEHRGFDNGFPAFLVKV